VEDTCDGRRPDLQGPSFPTGHGKPSARRFAVGLSKEAFRTRALEDPNPVPNLGPTRMQMREIASRTTSRRRLRGRREAPSTSTAWEPARITGRSRDPSARLSGELSPRLGDSSRSPGGKSKTGKEEPSEARRRRPRQHPNNSAHDATRARALATASPLILIRTNGGGIILERPE
jgi:hypothetical protein